MPEAKQAAVATMQWRARAASLRLGDSSAAVTHSAAAYGTVGVFPIKSIYPSFCVDQTAPRRLKHLHTRGMLQSPPSDDRLALAPIGQQPPATPEVIKKGCQVIHGNQPQYDDNGNDEWPAPSFDHGPELLNSHLALIDDLL